MKRAQVGLTVLLYITILILIHTCHASASETYNDEFWNLVVEAYQRVNSLGGKGSNYIDDINQALSQYEAGNRDAAISKLKQTILLMPEQPPTGRQITWKVVVLAITPPLFYVSARTIPALLWYYTHREWRVEQYEDK